VPNLRRLLLRAVAVAAPLALAALCVLPAEAAAPPGGVLEFDIVRQGETIGRHSMQFTATPAGLQVHIRTRALVKVAFVPVYRFEHDGEEVWRDGRLTQLNSVTNDDGDKHELHVSAETGGLAVVDNGRRSTVPAGILPASLWHDGVPRSTVLLNTLDGRQMAVQAVDLGPENVDAAGRQVATRHYRLDGDLRRDLWYDAAGVLVRVRLYGKDGSAVDYVLR